MRIPTPGHIRASQRGFTLLEILVVVLIIGVIINFAVLSVGDRAQGDTLDNESRRLERLMVLAQEEAELQGLLIGFRHTDRAIQWVMLSGDGRWMPYVESGPLRSRPITEPVEMTLRVEGRVMPPAQSDLKPDASMDPQGLFLSSGEATPMVIDLSVPGLDAVYRIEVDALGRVQRRRADDDV
ncbi:type II secretion system minor pseudopilin GspH [Flagellatimonas centrodinii]|uniref:type II secretion system minor pseudopilin GspH n=1 Tax=Flagellatimonas centrodinii TaxID=2806210 RepID=UPI001FF0063E|nr:type II secretion system minor pseudopilin GspH [Flagellatimonas centrodinii]ULQ46250.1 type II secretion system minor pseudopilin GspH [Flagellatimonas centrodinii]